MRESYDKFECGICLKDDESQEHIHTCKEIWKIRKESTENMPNYKKTTNGNAIEKLYV